MTSFSGVGVGKRIMQHGMSGRGTDSAAVTEYLLSTHNTEVVYSELVQNST